MTATILSRITGLPLTDNAVVWLSSFWEAESVVSSEAGQLWEREADRSDSEICPKCWGINPPEGVIMVEDDGAVCDCDLDKARGPRIEKYPYFTSGILRPGQVTWPDAGN